MHPLATRDESRHGPFVSEGRTSCYRCFRPAVGCICADVRRVNNRTHVLIVQHPRERRHPFGTTRIAALALGRVDVRRAAFTEAGWCCPEPAMQHPAALLHPGRGATVLEPGAPASQSLATLVVVDGTWPEAGKLVRDNAWLRALPRVALRPERPGRYRIRRARRPEVQLSTVEAITLALQVIEPHTPDLASLLETFDAMVERQLALSKRLTNRSES